MNYLSGDSQHRLNKIGNLTQDLCAYDYLVKSQVVISDAAQKAKERMG